MYAYTSSRHSFTMLAPIHLSALPAGYFGRGQSNQSRRLPSSGPYAALRGSLATGLLPGVRAAGPIHGASALDGHPCPSPPSARPLLGLLKSRRSRSRSKAKAKARARARACRSGGGSMCQLQGGGAGPRIRFNTFLVGRFPKILPTPILRCACQMRSLVSACR